ncbi:aspartate aminotransferase family protein [Metabacillus fastidiosus]|uniref:aminotransferase family protein n=1 Tax=Metabacillus fastidiosus TaxID=1458 RepID=UPI002E1C1288|nr:aspartate aminotransferase family protein [Metabacillus fastidiosus]
MGKSIDELIDLDKRHFIHPTSSLKQQQTEGAAHIFTKGKDIYLYDIHGKKFIDAMSSLWNVNIGHGREDLAKAAFEQMSKLAFSSCFSTFSNEPAIELAEKLASIAPEDLSAVFFTSGGSEANDTAYKLARHYWILKGEKKRKKIISRTKSYHGVAMGATSATGLKPFRDFTNSLAPDFCYADHLSAKSLRDVIEKEGPETVAAFIAEPVQGAGGVHIASQNYFTEVRKICDEYQILFIADEVITGFGRTGTYFGMEHYGIVPDIVCFAKGVTSGYAQLGGVILSKFLHEQLIELSTDTLFHGYTYSGHPAACAVALKNIEIIERENLIHNTEKMGKELLKGLKQLESTRKVVGATRGLGLMGAIELVKHKESTEQFEKPIAPLIVKEALAKGLICRAVVFDSQDTIVLAPPLTINENEIEKIIEIIDDILTTFEKK